MNLELYVTDISGVEYYVVCDVTCSGQLPNRACVDSDWDYNGYFDIDDVVYKKISGCTDDCVEFDIRYDQCATELQEKIDVEINKLVECEL